jgi:hypothetical protein
LPVLVGPSTAVTPAPGARPLARLDGDDEKAMISGWFLRRWRWARVPQKRVAALGLEIRAGVRSVSQCDASVVAA